MGINYKENNQWKEVKVKVGDNIPVGAEMDYDGSTIPVGWEEIPQVYGIIDSGSNANGNYIKFADGTLICTKTATETFSSLSAWGALYDGTFALGDWAETFITTPIVEVTPINSSGFVEAVRDASTTSAGRLTIARPTQVSSTNPWAPTVSILAIGRWK